jgi:mannose-6-phosphate isomerase
MATMNLLAFTPIYQDRVWGFTPIYQDRVWGGQNLARRLGRALPHTGAIGESWEIVDRDEAQSILAQSKLSLQSLLTDHRGALMGPGFTGERFPILVKWLDCQDCLSVQVHPPASVADQLGGEPKTECWFIADAEPDAGLYVGLKRTTDEAMFRQTLAGGQGASLQPLLHRLPTQAGEAILLGQPDLGDPTKQRHHLPGLRLGPAGLGRPAARSPHRRLAGLD